MGSSINKMRSLIWELCLSLERKTCAYVLRHSIVAHDHCSSYGNQSLDEDVALDRCPSHNWDGNHDAWHWHGHTLGSLGAAIGYDVPSNVVHVGKFCSHRFVLCNDRCLAYLTEDSDKQSRQMVEDKWNLIPHLLRNILARLWNNRSGNHVEHSAPDCWYSCSNSSAPCFPQWSIQGFNWIVTQSVSKPESNDVNKYIWNFVVPGFLREFIRKHEFEQLPSYG